MTIASFCRAAKKNLGVSRVAKADVPERNRVDLLGFSEPPGDGGRQLGVDPDLHAARIG
jgi:hypothetical protein